VLVVEYDGTAYCGFQLQAGQPTIQEELEGAITRLSGEKRRVIPASRTDTGVHALGQVVSFRIESSLNAKAFVNGLNYYLPEDIAVRAAYSVPESFYVRKAAVSREYSYFIINSETRSPLERYRAYHVSGDLNVENMNRACEVLIGEHDLASFVTSMEGVKSTVRRIFKAQVTKEKSLVVFDIVAKSFMPHQVRNTVGLLIRAGLGKVSVKEFYGIVKRKTPGLAKPTAPAHGLCLIKVNYPIPLEEYQNK